MYIYNITFHIEDEIIDEGLVFLKKEYIPKAIQSGIFFNPRICFIHPNHKEDGKSFSIQFHFKNKTTLSDWQHATGHILHQVIDKRFGNNLVGFITLMEELDLDI